MLNTDVAEGVIVRDIITNLSPAKGEIFELPKKLEPLKVKNEYVFSPEQSEKVYEQDKLLYEFGELIKRMESAGLEIFYAITKFY